MSLTGKQDRIRIANAGGYWGDDPGAFLRQLTEGPIDYITQDFLAEITMSILQKQRQRNPSAGYASDFVKQLSGGLDLLTATSTRVISNAGGINPLGCAEAVCAMARERRKTLSVAVVEGDDLMHRLDGLLAAGHQLSNMETDEPLSRVRDRITSANVYLGAAPVVDALASGAQIVVTGRVTDTGVTAAIPVYEFGWPLDDWPRLASAVVAGHILECGAQASGGNLTDWRVVPDFLNMGFPICEIAADGSFEISKHPKCGGWVGRQSVSSQLVYEMGDPRSYITPDVVADFTSIELEEIGEGRVRVRGAQGAPRPETLKVSISYKAGFKAHGSMIISGPGSVDKARATADIFWRRLDIEFEETSTELVGFNSCHGAAAPSSDPPEILLRLGARDKDRQKLEAFAELFPSLILSSVSGIAIVGARPKIQEVVAYWPCLIPAEEVTPTWHLLGSEEKIRVPWLPPAEGDREAPESEAPRTSPTAPESVPGEIRQVALSTLCYGRSGDKGDTCNIGIVARSPRVFPWLREYLTADRVKDYFGEMCQGEVERFEVPNLWALNFLLHQSLGGGGTVSLRVDPQGKTMADALLSSLVEIPASLQEEDK